jgi:sugar O-acyltransferase (sialic acid O-acetyltransferase NeuD family)
VSSTEKVVIIGAGDHGRGTLEILKAQHRQSSNLDVVGFLDDSVAKYSHTVGGLPVLGTVEWIESNHNPEVKYVLGIADCGAKRALANRLAKIGVEFVSAIHPTAVLGGGVKVMAGSIIGAGVVVAYDTLIEEHTTVNLNATIGHDCVVGRFSTVAPGANVAGRVRIAEGCDIGPNATLVKGINLGAWSWIGPGSVVLKTAAPSARLFGNPARMMPAT